MKIAPSRAAMNRSGSNTWANPASAVPTSTGAIAAGSVRGRAAISQILAGLRIAAAVCATLQSPSGPPRELREVSRPPLQVCVAALLCLLAHVEQQVGVVRELLD